LFAIHWNAETGKLTGSRQRVGAEALNIEYLRARGPAMPEKGIQSVTTPGCVDGWESCTGNWETAVAQSLPAAIYYAKTGIR